MNIQYFDSHAHYDDARFEADRDAMLNALPVHGVTGVVNAGSCIASSEASVALAAAFPHVYAAVGVHPHEAKTLSDDGMLALEALCACDKVVAVGEIGLDYYYDHTPRETQRHWFTRQLALAVRLNRPVVVHARDASAEVFDLVNQSGARRGVIHCYSGGVPMAMDYVEMGFYIGVGGVVTFDKTKKLPEVVAHVPLEHILIETDAPYQTPVPHRGKRNDSTYLPYIVDAIARIKGITPEAVAEATYRNAVTLFQI